jgi:hypothetical protein
MILKLIQKNKRYVIGALVGAVGGYAYYYFIGCANGVCAIKSNPYTMTAYGVFMGSLFFDMIHGFINPKNKNNGNHRND